MKKLLLVAFLLVVCGCMEMFDPQTGETKRFIDPNASAKVEEGVSGIAAMLQALTPLYPPLGGAGLMLLTALGIYKKRVKPKLVNAQGDAELYHSATATIVDVIENIKTDSPEIWEKLKPHLESEMGVKIENVVRAIRGKAPKE